MRSNGGHVMNDDTNCDDDYIREEVEKSTSYAVQLIVVMLTYLAMTFASVWALKTYDLVGFRTLVAVTPMLPMVYAIVVMINKVRAMDEMQRQIQLEAVLFSCVTTGMITGTYSLLEGVGYPVLGTEWVLPMLIISYGLGGFVARRRFK